MTKPWVRIVIVTFNSGCFTQICLDALAVQTNKLFEVVIFDNQSTDGMIEKLILPDERFSLTISTENLGFSGGSNQGLSGAETPFVMTLNPDTILAAECLEELLKAAEKYPETTLFSPVLFQDLSHEKLDGAGDSLSIFGLVWRNGAQNPIPKNLTELDVIEVFSPTGAAALFRRDIFESVGGFDDSFFCYLEDVDLALRLRARGETCLLVLQAKGTHSGGHSSDLIPGFALKQSVKNTIGMIVKSVPILLMPLMFILFIMVHFRFQMLNKGTISAQVRREGFIVGIRNIPAFIFVRLRRRRCRVGASYRIARSVSWSISETKERPIRVIKNGTLR